MTIQESLKRILEERDSLANLFYHAIFFEQYPNVKPLFANVNMQHQVVLLTMALMVLVHHYEHNKPATVMYLQYLGSKHHDRNIPPETFPLFRAAMLATLERFHGKEWDDALATQWQEAIDRGIQVMLEGYKQHFTV